MKKLNVPRSNTSVANQPLSAEVKEEYRSILLSYGIPQEQVNRLLSMDGIDHLREAQAKSINPEAILVLCGESFAMKWKQDLLLKVKEAGEAAKDLKRAARILRKWLPRAMLAAPEPPLREELFPVPISNSAVAFLALMPPEQMSTLWDVAGREGEKGLLFELAKTFRSIARTIECMEPRHHSIQLGTDHFLKGWDQLARLSNQRKRPCDDLGAWFLKATFGLKTNSVKTDTDWFRKMRTRAITRLREETITDKRNPRESSSTESLDIPPPDDLDTNTWARKEAERMERKFPGKKSYKPPKTPV